MTRTAAALLVLGLVLTGCSDASPSSSTSAEPSAPAASPDAAGTQALARNGTLVLRGDGLALRTPEGTQMIPFGSGTSVVAPALAASLGEPQPLAVTCGQGVVRDTLGVEGFDVLFDEDEFVGWDASGGTVSTEDGLAVGATRAEVQAALPDASFTTSTLGPEFTSSSGLAGFLDGEAPTSVVVGLTGGQACVVR